MYISSKYNSLGSSLSNSKLSIKTKSHSSLNSSPTLKKNSLKLSNFCNFLPSPLLSLPNSINKGRSPINFLNQISEISFSNIPESNLDSKENEIVSLTEKIKKTDEEIKSARKISKKNSIFISEILNAIASDNDSQLLKISNSLEFHFEKTEKTERTKKTNPAPTSKETSQKNSDLLKILHKAQKKHSLKLSLNPKKLFNIIGKKIYRSSKTLRKTIKTPKTPEIPDSDLKKILNRVTSLLVYLRKHSHIKLNPN